MNRRGRGACLDPISSTNAEQLFARAAKLLSSTALRECSWCCWVAKAGLSAYDLHVPTNNTASQPAYWLNVSKHPDPTSNHYQTEAQLLCSQLDVMRLEI